MPLPVYLYMHRPKTPFQSSHHDKPSPHSARHSLETLEAVWEYVVQRFVRLDAGAVVVATGRGYAVRHNFFSHLVLEEEPPAAVVWREQPSREGLHVHSPRRPANNHGAKPRNRRMLH